MRRARWRHSTTVRHGSDWIATGCSSGSEYSSIDSRGEAYALGATKLEVSGRIVVPAALSGIFASFVLAASRALGETMICALAAGSRVQQSGDPRESMQAMTGYILRVVSGDVSADSERYKSLFAVGALLFA